MDEVLCSVQTRTQESQASRSRSLRVRLGVVATMAIVIEYYVPEEFGKRNGKWIPSEQRGKIIPFPATKKKRVRSTGSSCKEGTHEWFGDNVVTNCERSELAKRPS